MLCAKFKWNLPNDSWEEDKNFTDRRTDDVQQVIKKTHLSFQLRRAENNNFAYMFNAFFSHLKWH